MVVSRVVCVRKSCSTVYDIVYANLIADWPRHNFHEKSKKSAGFFRFFSDFSILIYLTSTCTPEGNLEPPAAAGWNVSRFDRIVTVLRDVCVGARCGVKDGGPTTLFEHLECRLQCLQPTLAAHKPHGSPQASKSTGGEGELAQQIWSTVII